MRGGGPDWQINSTNLRLSFERRELNAFVVIDQYPPKASITENTDDVLSIFGFRIVKRDQAIVRFECLIHPIPNRKT